MEAARRWRHGSRFMRFVFHARRASEAEGQASSTAALARAGSPSRCQSPRPCQGRSTSLAGLDGGRPVGLAALPCGSAGLAWPRSWRMSPTGLESEGCEGALCYASSASTQLLREHQRRWEVASAPPALVGHGPTVIGDLYRTLKQPSILQHLPHSRAHFTYTDQASPSAVALCAQLTAPITASY